VIGELEHAGPLRAPIEIRARSPVPSAGATAPPGLPVSPAAAPPVTAASPVAADGSFVLALAPHARYVLEIGLEGAGPPVRVGSRVDGPPAMIEVCDPQPPAELGTMMLVDPGCMAQARCAAAQDASRQARADADRECGVLVEIAMGCHRDRETACAPAGAAAMQCARDQAPGHETSCSPEQEAFARCLAEHDCRPFDDNFVRRCVARPQETGAAEQTACSAPAPCPSPAQLAVPSLPLPEHIGCAAPVAP
jgi:hypothetical protein